MYFNICPNKSTIRRLVKHFAENFSIEDREKIESLEGTEKIASTTQNLWKTLSYCDLNL